MTKFKTLLTSGLLASLATTSFAVDYTEMHNDARVHSELLGASISYLINENCPDLSLRKFRLLNKAYQLQKHANTLGYSFGEIMDYLDSKAEQGRFRSIAEPMLSKQGARKGNAESYCAVGRAEIAKGSFAGKLLAD